MLRLRDFATLSLLSLVPQALATFLKVQNNCAFEIYCAGAKNDGRFTNVQNVLPGALYKSELAGDNDNIGTVAKCALNPHIQHPFQMEVAVRNGNTFLDLSAVDGDPFLPYDRYAEVDGGLCAIDCPPYTKDCEWPHHANCDTTADLTMYLCGHTGA